MTEGEDLSSGKVTEVERAAAQPQIQEESQRLRWKTATLWGVAVLIILLYLTLFAFLVSLFICWPSIGPTHTDIFLLVVLSAVPTLLLVNVMRIVSRRDSGGDDLESNAWLATLKDLSKAIADWLGKKN